VTQRQSNNGGGPAADDAAADPATADGAGKASRRPVAVAVSYAGVEGAGAPRVTASGHGAVAEQILAIAFEKGVKVREDADLAELLAAVDLDEEIPVEAFAAVAEVLTYVYRANGRAAGDRPDGAPNGPAQDGPVTR
jgi:flagellar biosynthesis protein